jgi:hypothetical protein
VNAAAALPAVLAPLADYTEQAEVTDWPARLAFVLVIIGLIALALWGMRRGWQNRAARQQDVPAPAERAPEGAVLSRPVPGQFAGTGINGDWMDRVVVHELGVRSRAALAYGPEGILLDRVGARSVFIPASSIVGVRADRGVAGTVKSKDGMVVVSWRLGERTVDSGFRADAASDHATVLDGLMAAFATDVR